MVFTTYNPILWFRMVKLHISELSNVSVKTLVKKYSRIKRVVKRPVQGVFVKIQLFPKLAKLLKDKEILLVKL